jgi:bacillithiol synthase
METSCTYLSYQQTRSFSSIVIDYLQQDEKLQPFFVHPPTLKGIADAIAQRKNTNTDRQLLVSELRKQYSGYTLSPLQEQHLDSLLLENTFTICTAHQPNIFTGHLYFIYKILHAIKLADSLQAHFPNNHFVPVYYMGSEDADLEELGHITIDGKTYKWNTEQTGAVGRMVVDKAFTSLIDEMQGQLSVLPYGEELVQLFRSAYTIGTTIQQATLKLVNDLFAEKGLLILIPDNPALKRSFNSVVKRELTSQFSQPLVHEIIAKLSENYKVQAGGRPINLFYLIDNKRERIEKEGDTFQVVNTDRKWSEEELMQEVDDHPERFSANVILRGVFQEMILPNIAFIGGGGELAYWLELRKVFEACDVPYPVLLLRNSFMLINEQQEQLAGKLGFTADQLFLPADDLLHEIIRRNNSVQLSLEKEKTELEEIYKNIEIASGNIDSSLIPHVQSLRIKQSKLLHELEKKMLRAEKKKYAAQQRQLQKIKNQLFPNNGLQERVDNFSYFYSMYGKEWLANLYNASCTVEQQFCILRLQ